MDDQPKPRRFALSPNTAFTLRDLDNVQPRVPPPRMATDPHPRLAPPGMAGVRTSERLGLSQKPPEPRGQRGDVKRTFTSLAGKREKSQGWER